VYGAALAPGFAGLYQVAIRVPASLGNGNWPVVATIGGVKEIVGFAQHSPTEDGGWGLPFTGGFPILFLAFALNVAAPITHFISFEVRNFIEPL
jgi:hypothetical protein